MVQFRLSKTKNKKYDVYYNGRWIPFGDKRYAHYQTHKDIPLDIRYKYETHNDPERRQRYRVRSRGILNKDGKKTYNNPNYSNYWAYHYLW